MEFLLLLQMAMLFVLMGLAMVLYKPSRTVDFVCKGFKWVVKCLLKHASAETVRSFTDVCRDEYFYRESLGQYDGPVKIPSFTVVDKDLLNDFKMDMEEISKPLYSYVSLTPPPPREKKKSSKKKSRKRK